MITTPTPPPPELRVRSWTIERVGIIGLLLLVILLAVRTCSRQVEEKVEQREVFVQREDSLQHYKDAYGREHAVRIQSQAAIETVGFVYRDEIDSLKAALDIKEKQLQSFALVGLQNQGDIRPVLERLPGDTCNYRLSYRDEWMELSGVTAPTPAIHYRMTDSLIVTTYWKRKWLLGRKQTYIDAYSLNPHVTVKGLTGVRILSERPKRWSLGPYVGYGFNGAQWQPTIGVGLQYAVIRF